MKIKPLDCELPEAPEIKNPLRRRQAKESFEAHCLAYHSDIFYSPVEFHAEMIRDMQRLVLAQNHKRMARAAPRGSGKTTLSVLLTEWALLHGHKHCSVWFCVNEAKAMERADALQGQLLTNGLLADDFPEICAPLKVEGKTDWVANGKKLPNGSWTLWRSIDGGNLGTLLDFMRPDFVALDDIEDVSTIRKTGHNVQTITAQKRFDRIDKEICYLTERGKGSILLVTTIRSRGCLSDLYTDPDLSPAWEGKVYSAIDFGNEDDKEKPEIKKRDELWNGYLALCGSKDSGKEPDITNCPSAETTCEILALDPNKYESFAPRLKKALPFYAQNREAMRIQITELDPVRIPIWDFYWQIGSDPRGREIVYSELQNRPLEDPFTKQMRFNESQLWKHQIGLKIGELHPEYKIHFAAVVVGTDAIHYEVKASNLEFTHKHLVECATIPLEQTLVKHDAIISALDGLRTKFRALSCYHVAVDIGTESGRDKGEWSEIVAKYCAMNRAVKWIALQTAHEWDVNQQHRAAFKNFCCEEGDNPFGVVKWNATHYKNRLAAAYNNIAHPITFYNPGSDDSLWKYIRSQTSEQYVQEFIPDKVASKATKEVWSPLPKFRNLTQFWKTASMVECLADIAMACKPRERPVIHSQNIAHARGRKL